MTRPLVRIAVIGFAVSGASFLAAGIIFASTAATAVPVWEILNWHDGRDACVNELGDAGEEITTREFAWSGRNSIQLNGSGTLRHRAGPAPSAIVRGPAYLLAHIENVDDRVVYDCDPGRDGQDVDVEFTGGNVREFSLRGSGDMFIENLDQGQVSISIAGSGSVTASGTADDLSLSIAGSGDANLDELIVREMRVTITGSGDAVVSPTDSVSISIAGSGDVELLTNPGDIETSIMGSGSVSGRPGTN